MTTGQFLAFAIVAGMMAAFVWGRVRYDLIALTALAAAVATGLVPPKEAFKGFADDVVVIVACALVTSAAIAKSGLTDLLIRRVADWLTGPATQVGVLAGAVMVLSALVKNIGALSMLMAPAIRIAGKTGTPVSRLLMPMSFASLLGGLVTLVGTSPNIIVSRIREEATGRPFSMFDFTPVGLPLAAAGLLFLILGYRLLPADRKGPATMAAAFNIRGYQTEVVVPEGASAVGRRVDALLAAAAGAVRVAALIRAEHKRWRHPKEQIVRADDHLLLEGEPEDLEAFVAASGLKLVREEKTPDPAAEGDDIGVMEAVVTAESMMVNWTPTQLRLAERFNVNLLAVSRAGEAVAERLKSVRFRVGDVVLLQGNLKVLPEILGALGCLPLAERDMKIGRTRRSFVPVAILAAFMTLMALEIVPVTLAFFGAAVLILASRFLTMREAYQALDAGVIVTLACLIPVSDAMRTTGATDLISAHLSSVVAALPPFGALALVMMGSMAITPFLNNAATVLVAGPIAAGLAKSLGQSPDPYLMAIAIGAACDFLTPIGHQCNMLVMGPGGYRFGDYWRLGLPLSILVVLLGVPLIATVWPF